MLGPCCHPEIDQAPRDSWTTVQSLAVRTADAESKYSTGPAPGDTSIPRRRVLVDVAPLKLRIDHRTAPAPPALTFGTPPAWHDRRNDLLRWRIQPRICVREATGQFSSISCTDAEYHAELPSHRQQLVLELMWIANRRPDEPGTSDGTCWCDSRWLQRTRSTLIRAIELRHGLRAGAVQDGWMRSQDERWHIDLDLWDRLLTLCEKHEVTFVWVRSHSGNPENERCDWLATEARRAPDLLIDAGYRPMDHEPG